MIDTPKDVTANAAMPNRSLSDSVNNGDAPLLEFSTLRSAYDICNRTMKAGRYLVKIDGEVWDIDPQARCAILHDKGPRDRGERCTECGKRRDPGADITITVGELWLYSQKCFDEHRDHYAEPDPGSDNDRGEQG